MRTVTAADGFGRRWGRTSAINLTTVANLDDEYAHHPGLDAADQPVVAHAILPEVPQRAVLEGFAKAVRVFEPGHALAQEDQDAPGVLTVELSQLTLRGGIELNPPGDIFKEEAAAYGTYSGLEASCPSDGSDGCCF